MRYTRVCEGICPVYNKTMKIDVYYNDVKILGQYSCPKVKKSYDCLYYNESEQCGECPIFNNAPPEIV